MTTMESNHASHPSPDAWRPAPRFAIFCILGLVLYWLIISHSVVAYLSFTAPKAALWIKGNEPRSLLALADKEINASADEENSSPAKPSPKRLKELRDEAEVAFLGDPVSSQAYRLLGQIAELEGSVPKAEKLMRAAAQHSLHEAFAVDWLMRKNFERKNYPATAYYADVLARSGAVDVSYLMPVLARMAEVKNAQRELEKLLVSNPAWRRGFFFRLSSHITDARTPLELFTFLKDTRAPPTTEELNAYQWFLFDHKLYGLAYYVWMQFLPPEKLEAAGFLYNGDFELKPSGSPFDWNVQAGSNAIVDFPSRPENATNHALVLALGPGRVEFPGVTQRTMLSPGAYSFKASFSGAIVGPRGVQWDIRCMTGASLGQSQMILGTFKDWRELKLPFVVPDGCTTQEITLRLAARSPSEQLVSGEIWFDGISISREAPKDSAK
jgi:hypothetical protein